MTALDDLDAALVEQLRAEPRATEARLARLLGVARGTVHARIERMQTRGIITGYGPDVDGPAIGFGVLAFITLEITQGADDGIVQRLAAIDEVLEIHAVSGSGDLVCRTVAKSNDHLHELIQRMLEVPGVSRTETQLALKTLLRRSEADLAARPASSDRG
jgi:DNA-binding Lrp family transcriptional regulator